MIDDYNWIYRGSIHKSFRYSDQKELDFNIPPYHFALVRLFMNFDGHLIKNGFKIAASSNIGIMKHNFDLYKINFPDFVGVKLDGVGTEGVQNYK